MKNTFLFLTALVIILSQSCESQQPETTGDYPITPVDFTRVHLQDGFWKQWVETARDSTIPYAFRKCEETGRIDNFIYAAGIVEGRFRGRFGFDDSDVYKIMEGASYALMLEKDPKLEAYLDTLIRYISGAQEEDGYLYTAWTLQANEYNDFACCSYSEEGRFVGTSGASHEFYNAGHMYEAAVAHYMATGRRNFLEVALKNADLIYRVCIEQGNDYVPGHQEIEIGLVKLYRVTGDEGYLELAKHLLDIRAGVKDDEYSQAHLPVTEQKEAVGHAVRANYMYSAMADVAALTGDTAYLEAVDALWNNVAGKKLSVTGGVGASHRGEAYGDNYELPNHPYNETCAAIANVYWNHRMFLLHGEAKYMDVLERSLYNGVMPGLSLDGTLFFYPNTLRHDGVSGFNQGVSGRSPWFDCSCCPSNLSRFVPSVAGYAYAVKNGEVFVNLFMNGEAEMETGKGTLKLKQQSMYPWEGKIKLEILSEEPTEAGIHVRIPGWAMEQPVPSDLFTYADAQSGKPSLQVNGDPVSMELRNGYVTVERTWEQGDRIELDLPMEARIITAHDSVEAKKGLVAVQYGPLVYCAEEIDNRKDVLEASIGTSSVFKARYDPGLLEGVNV
ncbi:MAG: glycoside hydrolase family 127 protein, partial [Bacteroidales bacterium]